MQALVMWRVLVVTMVTVVALTAAGTANATGLPFEMVPNGPIHATKSVGDTTFIGGDFSWMAKQTGPMATFRQDGTTFDGAEPALQTLPKVSGGGINVIESDGAGGWFIGGTFTQVAGVPRPYAAHIKLDIANGAAVIDSTWNPALNGPVTDIEFFDGVNDAVIIGGVNDVFTGTAPNDTRSYLRTWSISNGDISGEGTVPTAIASLDLGKISAVERVGQSETLMVAVNGPTEAYVEILTVGTIPSLSLVHIPSLQRAVKTALFAANVRINDLESLQGRMLVVGNFDETKPYAGTYTPAKNALILGTASQLSSFNAGFYADGEFLSATYSGQSVYIAGTFSIIAGQSRSRLAELDVSSCDSDIDSTNCGSGAPTAWTPNLGSPFGSPTYVKQSASGSHIYVAGDFHDAPYSLSGNDDFLVAFPAGSASCNGCSREGSFNPRVNGSVHAIFFPPVVTTSPPENETISRMVIGGDFTGHSGERRANIAAYRTSTGALLPWNPAFDHSVHALATNLEGTNLYVAGRFGLARSSGTTGAGIARQTHVARLLVSGALAGSPTGLVDDAFNLGGPDMTVNSGTSCTAIKTWNAAAAPCTVPIALAVGDTNLFVAGGTVNVEDQSELSGFLGSFSLVDGSQVGSVFDMYGGNGYHGGVRSLAVEKLGVGTERLYAGGGFNSITSIDNVGTPISNPSDRVARFTVVDGGVLSYDPTFVFAPTFNNVAITTVFRINAIAVAGSDLFWGGKGAASIPAFGSVDIGNNGTADGSTVSPIALVSDVLPLPDVRSIHVSPDLKYVYVGGQFIVDAQDELGALFQRSNLVRFDLNAPLVPQAEFNLGVVPEINSITGTTSGILGAGISYNYEGSIKTFAANIAPDDPTNLTHTATNVGEENWSNTTEPVQLSFMPADPDSDVLGYRIEIANNSDFVSPIQTITGASATVNPTIDVSGLPSGIWYWRVRSIDPFGAESPWTVAPGPILLDTLPPTPPIIASIQWTNQTDSLNLSWTTPSSDGNSGIFHYKYCVAATEPGASSVCPDNNFGTGTVDYASLLVPLILPDSGNATACVRAVDKAGNVSNWACTAPFGIDTTPPNWEPGSVRDGSQLGTDEAFTAAQSSVSFNWTIPIAVGGPGQSPEPRSFTYCAGTELPINNWCTVGSQISAGSLIAPAEDGAITSYTDTGVIIDGDPTIYVCVRMLDAAGNSSSACSNGVQYDTTAPNASVTVSDISYGEQIDTNNAFNTTTINLSWANAAGDSNDHIAYEWCLGYEVISNAPKCSDVGATPAVGWTEIGEGAGGVGGRTAPGIVPIPVDGSTPLLSGARYRLCVRPVDQAGNRGLPTCGDPVVYDNTVPYAPATAVDLLGSVDSAIDSDYTNRDAGLYFYWSGQPDPTAGGLQSSGNNGYLVCILQNELSVTACTGSDGQLDSWQRVDTFPDSTLKGHLWIDNEPLTENVKYRACIKTIDNAGNISSVASCTSGITSDHTAPDFYVTDLNPASTSTADAFYSTATDTLKFNVSRPPETLGAAPLIPQLQYCIGTAIDTSGADPTCGGDLLVASQTITDTGGAMSYPTMTALPLDSRYFVCITKTDLAGNTGRACSDGITIVQTIPTDTPTNVTVGRTAAKMGDFITADWNDATSSTVSNFEWCVRYNDGVDHADCSANGDAAIDWTPTVNLISDATFIMTETFFGGPLKDGALYRVCVRAVLAGGGYSSADTCSIPFVFDNTAPTAPAVIDRWAGETSTSIDRDRTTALSGVNAYWSGGTDPIGTYGSSAGISNFKVCIGTSPPSGTTCATGWQTVNLQTATGSIERSTTLSINPSQRTLVCVKTVDTAGLESSAACSDGIVSDTAAPVVSMPLDRPFAEPPVSGDDIEFTQADNKFAMRWPAAVDAAGGDVKYKVCWALNNTCTGTGTVLVTGDTTNLYATYSPVTAYPEGTKVFGCIKALDDASTTGNISAWKCSSGVRVDTTAPVLAQPNDGAATGDLDFVNAGNTGGGTRVFGNWAAGTDSTANAALTSGVGSHEYCFTTSTDPDSCHLNPNESSSTIQPWTAPGVPTNGVFNTTLYAFPAGVALTNGEVYFLCVRVYDRATNATTRCSDGQLYDNIAPSGTLAAFAGSQPLSGTVSAQGTASDEGSGIAEVSVKSVQDKSACKATLPSESSWNCAWVTSSFADGSYQMVARITDRAGNFFDTSQTPVTLQNQPVAPTVNPPVISTVGGYSLVRLNWSKALDIGGQLVPRYTVRYRKSGVSALYSYLSVIDDHLGDNEPVELQLIGLLVPGLSYDIGVASKDGLNATSAYTDIPTPVAVPQAIPDFRLRLITDETVLQSCGSFELPCQIRAGSETRFGGSLLPFVYSGETEVQINFERRVSGAFTDLRQDMRTLSSSGQLSVSTKDLTSGLWRLSTSYSEAASPNIRATTANDYTGRAIWVAVK